METLTVLPALSDLRGTHRCRLGPAFMARRDVTLAGCVKVTSRCCVYVCAAWPRQDGAEGYIQFDPTVVTSRSDVSGTLCAKCVTDNDSPNIQNELPTSNVRTCQTGKLTSIHVKVILEDYRDVNKLKASDALRRNVFSVLRDVYVCGNAVVRCGRTRLGRLLRVCCVVVETAQCDGVDAECGKVTPETRIVVRDVTGRERFLQQLHGDTGPRLAGLDRERAALLDVLRAPLLLQDCRERFLGLRLGLQPPRGVLVRGPSGCGKTSLVKSVAMEMGAYCEHVTGSEFGGGYPGDAERKLRATFERATELSRDGPCVLLIDEVDVLCPQKGARGSSAQERRLVATLSALLDELPSRENLVVVGATSRPGAVNPELRVAGRLKTEIFLGIPRLSQRKEILRALCTVAPDAAPPGGATPVSPAVDLDALAEATPGFTGADMQSLLNAAAHDAFMRAHDKASFIVQQDDVDRALHRAVPSAQRGSDIVADFRPVAWDEIGGLEGVKEELRQAVELPLRYPEALPRLGLRPPRGVLLYGPPGCAKTTLARACATACHVTFLAVSGAQLFSPFVGDSEKKLAEAFQQARAGAPSILFIDEIDSLVGRRSGGGAGEGGRQGGVQERVLSTLLNEMDGIGLKTDEMERSRREAEGETASGEEVAMDMESVDNQDVLLMAATNRPDMVDEALLRPGRIDKLIYVPLPDVKARRRILEVHSRTMPLDGVELDEVAEATDGFTGADLENLCREAGLYALTMDGLAARRVHHHHFAHVLQSMKPSLSPEQIHVYSQLLHGRDVVVPVDDESEL